MRAASLTLLATLAVAGCESNTGVVEATPAATATATATATEAGPRADFVGAWSGELANGDSVFVSIPPEGAATYEYRGRDVRVLSTRMQGGDLELRLRGATVTLTPREDGLGYVYRDRDSTAPAILRPVS